MKRTVTKTLLFLGLLCAFAAPGHAEESKRGLFEADLTGGGHVVFFVQANQVLSAYVFDAAANVVSYAGGAIADDDSFNLTSNTSEIIAGAIDDKDLATDDDDVVTATVAGQSVSAQRVSEFGPSDDIPGRFIGTAHGTNGTNYDVKIVIDAQNRIYFMAVDGTTVLGGVGTVSLVTGGSKAILGNDDPPGDDHGGNGDDDPPGDDHGHGADDDVVQDLNEDVHDIEATATFSVTLLSGGTVTGNLTFGHHTMYGDFTLSGVTYSFFAPRESAPNRLANISTRGFVNTDQGQLIGGFIISGGPKLVLIRALGPSLAAFGVTSVLENPVLKLMEGSTELKENDDWQTASNAAEITATGIAPQSASEPSILVRLEPGSYTAVVSGANDSTGIALVEVYEIEHD